MAYVIWRVVMKKYTRVRLGLGGSTVTPAGRHALTYDDESWKSQADEQKLKESSDDIARSSDVRQSKTKRVKNYLKKCKNALGSRSNSQEQSNNGESSSSNSSSWYLDQKLEISQVNEVDEVFEDAQVCLNLSDFSGIYQKANVVEVKDYKRDKEVIDEEVKSDKFQDASDVIPDDNTKSDSGFCVENEISGDNTVCSSDSSVTISPFLNETQEEVDDEVTEDYVEDDTCQSQENTQIEDPCDTLKGKSEVASLVDKYFGSLYKNYNRSRKCLVRQARDLLVCEYRGCLQRFENEFCVQAAKLLHHLKDGCTSSDGCSPSGWPLCIGPSGIVIHLSPLDPSIVRNKDCYLCIRHRSAPGLEITLIWRKNYQIHCHTIAEFKNPLQNLDDIMCSNIRSATDLEISSYDDYDGAELPELLQNLLVSIEHAIERIPLDDLTFPCPQCLEYLPLDRDVETNNTCACQCSCKVTEPAVLKKDSCIQTSPMFEFAGSIPHIDSDDDDEKESIRSGSTNKRLEIARPKRITDLPDKLLMSGINLPGTEDREGRPIILCYAECISRAGLNKYEVAKLLLYYSSIPTTENREKGFTILLLAENEEDSKSLAILDKTVCLLEKCMKISRILIWRPGVMNSEIKTLASRVQAIVVTDEASLIKYLHKDQTPASCGGSCNHDQLEWVEFYKQLEPFLSSCQSVGSELVSTLSQLRSEDLPIHLNRRFLSHQCRQISKALDLDSLLALRQNGRPTLKSLNERSQWLSSSRDVKRSCAFANTSYSSVERVAKRMEKLENERKERLKDLAKLRTLHEESEELLSWTQKVGDETLNKLTILLRSAEDSTSVKEVSNDFEKFFYNAWRQIEKANDLYEECKNITDPKGQNFKDSANCLQGKMKNFKEQLEETRVHIEDSSRCFILLESCEDILEDDHKEQNEFIQLAMKSGNDKLMQICKTVEKKQEESAKPTKPPDKPHDDETHSSSPEEDPTITSTPIKSQNTQIRRRSVSSLAFIYHCNHHAAGEVCNCYDSDTENSLSYKLKKKYIQTLKNCDCNNSFNKDNTLERKNSATLDGIKEERESVEDLLEKIESDDCRRCDSGLSTADNSVGEESVYKSKKIQRTCSCQYYRESCALCSATSSSTGSNHDHTDNQQDSIIEEGSDGFIKSNSSDDIEEEHYPEERRKVPPVSANNHLYCHASTLDLPSDALYNNMDPKTQKTLKYIIKEMIETERDYVKSLDYVIVNYIPQLMREDIPQALRGQRNVVFGNVEKIYEFHSQHFVGELEECENNPLLVGQIFLKYKKRFNLYALYNKNKPKSDSLMSEYGTVFFKDKQIELEDKMDLASYLLKPVQRMGKYALLLQQMMKACPPPPSNSNGSTERIIQEFEDLTRAEEMVRFQLRHGNDLLAMDSIRECDVNLKEQGTLLRQSEFLVWEGKSGKKHMRQVFLFEELILFSKARRLPDRKNLDLYIYKNSIKMTDIGLTANGDSPTKFEIWFRKRKPNDTFTLQAMSVDVKKVWTEELLQLLWRQAIKNRAVRLAEMSSMGIGNKPCLDIRPSADQISDRSISFAQLSRTAPRFRNSFVGSVVESCRSAKRPHSVISMSSVSSSSTSSGGSGGIHNGQTNSSFESSCDSPKPYHRSATLNSQCSVESGIIADMSLGSDECSEQTHPGLLENQNF